MNKVKGALSALFTVYLKWLVLAIIDILSLVTLPVAVPLISSFTRAQPYDQAPYTWGWIWGTYDNPPQGDEGYVAKRAYFLGVTTGFKGWLNRMGWMIRNPLYGYAKICGVKYNENNTLVVKGDENISDKYGRPGWMFARLYDPQGKLIAFEFYGVFPYMKTKDVRMRLGWKMTTSKFKEYGFAQLVDTINPFDGYGS